MQINGKDLVALIDITHSYILSPRPQSPIQSNAMIKLDDDAAITYAKQPSDLEVNRDQTPQK